MACIHFKFKNSLDYDSITFDGLHIALKDLKRMIMSRKKLRDTDDDLQIINAITKKAYSNDEEMIPKNSSVIVARIPVTNAAPRNGPKTLNHPNAYKEDPKPVRKPIVEVPVSKTPDLLETGNLVDANASEEDKIKAMMRQSTMDFDPANYVSKKAPMGTPSPTYICKKCGKSGHFIQNCPVEPGEAIDKEKLAKRPTGIPHSFLTVVNDPNAKGALLIGPGQYGVPTIDMNAYKEKKKERPPFLPEEKLPEPKKEEVPAELLCPLCKDLLTDAVVIQCCGSSFCDECIRNYLLESEDHVCPQCHKSEQSPDRLIAIKSLRSAVTNYRNETGYTKVTKARLNAQRERREAVEAVASAAAQKMEARQETAKLTNSSDAPITPQAIKMQTQPPVSSTPTMVPSTSAPSHPVSFTPTMVPSTSAPSHPVQSAAGTSQIPSTSQHMTPRPPVIPANFPTVPIQTVGVPYRPPCFVGPPPPGAFGPGPGPTFAPAPPMIPVMPLSKEAFYRRQKKMQEQVKKKKAGPLDARQIMDYKKKPKSASRSRSKCRSRSPRQSHSPRRSRNRSRSRSLTTRKKKRSRSRSLNRSRSPFGKRPCRSRSRSRSPRSRASKYRSRSRSRSFSPRYRSRSPRRRSFSRSPPRFRSRSRTPPCSRRLGRYDRLTSPSYGRRRSRSPPSNGRPVGRGPPPPPYPYPHDPHNRFDRHAYDEFYHEFYARYGLPPPPPPPPPNSAIYDAPPYPPRRSRSPRDRRPYKDRSPPRPKQEDKPRWKR